MSNTELLACPFPIKDSVSAATDRGRSDSYYRRSRSPHYYTLPGCNGERIEVVEGTPEYEAYNAGYTENELDGDFKSWY